MRGFSNHFTVRCSTKFERLGNTALKLFFFRSTDEKQATPKSSPTGAANLPAVAGPVGPPAPLLKPGLPVPPFGLPGFPGGPIPFNAENGYRPPFDHHPAMRPQLAMPPGGKP